MIKLFLLLLFRTVSAGDICISRVQDGNTNEQGSISEEHCRLYDRINHNNVSTLQEINLDGTIAGCWLYETNTEEIFYWNSDPNPSGMCSAPHYCIQYATCSDAAAEVLYVEPTIAPTTNPTIQPTNSNGGIGTAGVTDPPSSAPTRSEPSYPTKNIILIATIALVSFLVVMGYFATQTRHRQNVTYGSRV